MEKLSTYEITTLAKLTIKDPETSAVRTRLLIGYAMGLDFKRIRLFNGKNIENNWLVVDEDARWPIFTVEEKKFERRIPIHPLILKIFEHYHYEIPSFEDETFFELLLKLSTEMDSHFQKEGKMVDWLALVKKLNYSFRFPLFTWQDMQAQGIAASDASLLTGWSIRCRANHASLQKELEALFHHPFFDFLKLLAAQYHINGNL